MNVPDLIASSIRRSAVEVFSTMLSVDLKPGNVSVGSMRAEPNDGLVSFVGLAGAWIGTGSITCAPSLACRICAQMLMTEVRSVDETVLDAVAELTNIIIGNVKTDLEQHLGPLGLSIPTVIFGKNFATKSAGNAAWVVEPFRWDDEDLLVRVCLAPNEKHGHLATRPPGKVGAIEVQI